MSGKTHWYADEENGITTDGKRYYCPERDELREWKAAATPYLEDLLDNEYMDLDAMCCELEAAKNDIPPEWDFDLSCSKKRIEGIGEYIREQQEVCDKLHRLLPDYDMLRSAK